MSLLRWPLKLQVALLLAALLNLGLSFGQFYDRAYDSWSHLFFASHYLKSWFDPWEPRWFTGFSVYSYPPMAHQSLALLAQGLGLERAYVLMDFLLMSSLPLAVFLFSSSFVSESRAGNAAILSVFLPSLLRLNYAYGQITAVFSLWLVLAGFFYFHCYLLRGNLWHLLVSVAFLASSITSHHHTGGFLVPPFFFVVALHAFLGSRRLSTIIRRTLIASALVGTIVAVAVLPFWQYLLSGGKNQQSIFHASRGNIFGDVRTFKEFFIYLYLFLLLLLPYSFIPVLTNRKLIPLLVLGVLFFVLSLGGTTPLPRLLFGDFWLWLTYERFALWCAVALIPLWGALLEDLAHWLSGGRRWILSVSISMIALITANYMFTQQFFVPTQPLLLDLGPSLEFLQAQERGQWRYMTLDYGWGQVGKLASLSDAPSLDGIYFTGRPLPELRNSGVGMLNDARFYPGGLDLLKKTLLNAEGYHLKYILVRGNVYDAMLKTTGFRLLHSMETTGDSRYGDMRIWVKDDVPPLSARPSNPMTLSSFLWGVMPLAIFGSGLVLIFLRPQELLPRRPQPSPSDGT